MTAPTAAAPVAEDGVGPIDAPTPPAAPDEVVEQDLLVEDVSIDGMCGVY